MKRITCPILLVLPLALSACGGGSTGTTSVASTPTTPGVTYTRLADMSGDRTFQTAGVHYASAAGGISGPVADAVGSGVVVRYTAASDSYQLTAPDGTTASFGPANFNASASSPNVPNVIVYQNGSEALRLTVPTSSGVALSYTLVGNWLHPGTSGMNIYVAVGGASTLASDMPRTGTANYTIGVGGSAVVPNGLGGATGNPLNGTSTGTFAANFGTGAINTSLHLVSTGGTDFGTFTGTGTIGSNSSGFTGTFAGTTSSAFSGGFFGPQAAEVGMSYFIGTPTFSAAGAVTGVKQ
jgi:hypothetical protein